MASTDTPITEPEKVAPPPESATAVPLEAPVAEPEKVVDAPVAEPEKVAPPLEEASREVAPPTPRNYFVVAEVVLRLLLFAASVTAVVVLVTSNQTEIAPVPVPPFRAPREAKFSHSPALIYFLAALSFAGFYSIITTATSFLAILKPACSSTKLQLHFVIFDVLLLGIVAAATGVAGGVAYIALKGNTHVGWNKICGIYDVFCRHVAASVAVSLFASIVLVLIVLLSVYSLSKKIPK